MHSKTLWVVAAGVLVALLLDNYLGVSTLLAKKPAA